MRRIAFIVTGLLAVIGCGGDDGWKATCSATKPCEAGNYCAETPDGNVCGPDEAPVISSVQATCGGSTTCRRDGTLHVEVEATDTKGMGRVEVALSLEGTGALALQRRPDTDIYEADISLAEARFEVFEQHVVVTASARDEAGHTVAADTNVDVTRLAWTRQLASVPLWSPAVTSGGQVLLAASNGRLHFVDKSGEGSSSVNVTSSPLNGPAAIGSGAIWVGSEDGRLYPVSTNGAVGTPCNAGAAMLGAPVIRGTRAISATKSSFVAVANGTGGNSTAVATPAEPVVNSEGRVFVPSSGRLRSYAVAANGALVEEWTETPPAPAVGDVFVPPSIDADGAIWTTRNPGPVFRTTSSGAAQQVAADPPVSDSSSGTIVLADGSAVLGEFSTSALRRLSAGAAPSWTESEALDGHPGIPLAVAGAVPGLLVGTDNGWLAFVRQGDGTVAWKRRISRSALQPPNIWTEPGATTSTAYLAGADGYLYAVIVDGTLDTSAPWPKAYHDPQNTSNARGVTP